VDDSNACIVDDTGRLIALGWISVLGLSLGAAWGWTRALRSVPPTPHRGVGGPVSALIVRVTRVFLAGFQHAPGKLHPVLWFLWLLLLTLLLLGFLHGIPRL